MGATVDRYTYSTANYNDWVYLDESLLFLQQLGFATVQARILELTQRLWAGLSRAGFASAYDHGEQPRSGILCVRKPGVSIEAVCAGLTARGFVTRVRLDRLRLAPHVYLSPEQMDGTVEAIRQMASL
jgi:selenocysteine lyase/cysteine desulfurase